MNGPAPELQERKFGSNCHFYKPRKHRIAGLPLMATTVYVEQDAKFSEAQDFVPVVTTTGAGAQTIPAHQIGVRNVLVTPKYPAQIYRKQSLVFKSNGGLKVVFTDANVTGASDKNHIYWQCWTQAGTNQAANNPNECSAITAAYRVWFSDD